MDIIKHADKERRIGFFDYLKSVFTGGYFGEIAAHSSLAAEKAHIGPTIFQRIAGASELTAAALTIGYGAALALGPLSLSAYSFYNGNIAAGIIHGASSAFLSFPARYCIRMGQYFGKIGKARFNGVQDKDLERIKYEGLKTFHPDPNDPGNKVIDNFIEREFDSGTITEYLMKKRDREIEGESKTNREVDPLKEELPLAYGKLSDKAAERLKRKINAFRRFDMERAQYSRAEIEEILRQEGVIGSGLSGKIRLAWILLTGMEFFYHTKLKFESDTYTPLCPKIFYGYYLN